MNNLESSTSCWAAARAASNMAAAGTSTRLCTCACQGPFAGLEARARHKPAAITRHNPLSVSPSPNTHLVLPHVGKRWPPQGNLKHCSPAISSCQAADKVVRARLVPEAPTLPNNCTAGAAQRSVARINHCCRLAAKHHMRVGALERKTIHTGMHATIAC